MKYSFTSFFSGNRTFPWLEIPPSSCPLLLESTLALSDSKAIRVCSSTSGFWQSSLWLPVILLPSGVSEEGQKPRLSGGLSDSATPSGQQWLSEMMTWSSLSVMVMRSWLQWLHLSGIGFISCTGRHCTRARLWCAPQAIWSTTRPARCSTFCGFVTGNVVVMRPNWQPLPQAHISLLSDRASVCSSPHASCKILTDNRGLVSESEILMGCGSGTHGWSATAHWPAELLPHMYTTPLSVTAPLWKLPAATVITRCPSKVFSKTGLPAHDSSSPDLQGSFPKLYTSPPETNTQTDQHGSKELKPTQRERRHLYQARRWPVTFFFWS